MSVRKIDLLFDGEQLYLGVHHSDGRIVALPATVPQAALLIERFAAGSPARCVEGDMLAVTVYQGPASE